MIRNKKVPISSDKLNLFIIDIKTGNNRTISTSKIKKIMASKKKRREKGNRADLIGSNPHSNGDLFSRSLSERFDKIHPKDITIKDNISATILLKKLLNILALEIEIPC
jgi:hypothetical protein